MQEEMEVRGPVVYAVYRILLHSALGPRSFRQVQPMVGLHIGLDFALCGDDRHAYDIQSRCYACMLLLDGLANSPASHGRLRISGGDVASKERYNNSDELVHVRRIGLRFRSLLLLEDQQKLGDSTVLWVLYLHHEHRLHHDTPRITEASH